jgi:hypothetical protein
MMEEAKALQEAYQAEEDEQENRGCQLGPTLNSGLKKKKRYRRENEV